MTQSPVSLAEFRSYVNAEESDGHADDESMWQCVLAATRMVEVKVGPIRPREQVSKVAAGGCALLLPVFPALSLTSVADSAGTTLDVSALYLDEDAGLVERAGGFGSPRRYTATYTVGRDPVPDDLMQAVLSVAQQLWDSQRGPGASNRFTGMGGDEQPVYRGFAWPNRALQLIEPYLVPTVG